ncbi:MAG: hypothetical protein NZM38_04975 [Cytophagales bacterium]|nr:hypothetical protein [Cytophagales bacterium]MDW8384105.1 hypothetical protein [Flammeovirgaceae bacterium]
MKELNIFCFAIVIFFQYRVAAQDMRSNLFAWLKRYNCQLKGSLNKYDYERYNSLIHQQVFELSPSGQPVRQYFEMTAWEVSYTAKLVRDRQDAVEIEVTYRVTDGKDTQILPAVELHFSKWDTANYVLLPAAVYKGNRFASRRIQYSPKLLDPKDIGPDKPTYISDVPRLAIGDGFSRIEERSGSMSVPSIGFYAPAFQYACWILTDVSTKYGDIGISIEETRLKTVAKDSANRSQAFIKITPVCVRERYKYRIADMQFPSDDRAPDWKQGDEIKLRFRIYLFEATQLQSLFSRFQVIRKDIVGETPFKHVMPLSEAYQTVHDKFNRSVEENGNWDESFGYYTVGNRENFLQDWQIGWTGGMISTLPLLIDGTKLSQDRVLRVFNWLFPNGIAPSGFFWDSGEKGNIWYGGDIRKPTSQNWHLVRKGGDGLYYVLKHFFYMQENQIPIQETWKNGVKTVADAFVKVWKENGQFGNFIDTQTGKIAVGGSTSGAILPAALMLASAFFQNPEYAKVAQESAEYFYHQFVKKGYTNGGPGDAMQNPDSESCYALLESFTILYDFTGEKKWLQYADELAEQFTTWVMAYDYRFPPESTFGKLGMSSLGAVFANTQNKHGAPGVCTFSGIALLRLYRYTNKMQYIKLLQEITHAIPQFLCHPKRPIADLPFGWMSERVSTTDWLEGIGEIVRHTTWAETTLMLAYSELPGVYLNPEKSILVSLDHIEAMIKKNEPKKLSVLFNNPTEFEAKVKVLVDKNSSKPLSINPSKTYEIVKIPARSSVEKVFGK